MKKGCVSVSSGSWPSDKRIVNDEFNVVTIISDIMQLSAGMAIIILLPELRIKDT